MQMITTMVGLVNGKTPTTVSPDVPAEKAHHEGGGKSYR
jgi:hypothetical protein